MKANSDTTPGLFETSNPASEQKRQKPCRLTRSSRGRQPNGEANPIDVHLGDRIRLRRILLGLSQEQLAKLLGLTFQQVQKYERGMNRVGGSRLWDLARVLGVHVGYFYEEMDEKTAGLSPRMLVLNTDQTVISDSGILPTTDPMEKKETIELVRAYYKIPNRRLAKNLFDAIIASSKSYVSEKDEE